MAAAGEADAEDVDVEELVPDEMLPYSGGRYEQMMQEGNLQYQFKVNKNVTSNNLIGDFGSNKFRLAVWTLNPYLHKSSAFRALSKPFEIKAALHNDVRRNERYVRTNDGAVVACLPTDVPRKAPLNRRQPRGAADDDDDEDEDEDEDDERGE